MQLGRRFVQMIVRTWKPGEQMQWHWREMRRLEDKFQQSQRRLKDERDRVVRRLVATAETEPSSVSAEQEDSAVGGTGLSNSDTSLGGEA